MARKKRVQKDTTTKAEQTEQAEKALKAHLRALGLTTVDQYKAWCSDHSFGRGTYKTRHQRGRELNVALLQEADARRIAVRRQSRNADRVIDSLFRDAAQPPQLQCSLFNSIERAIKMVKHDRVAKRALEQLVRHIQGSAQLPDDRSMVADLGTEPGNTFVGGLAALALHSRAWHRGVESWKPRSHNIRRQFASLARHLLAEYNVPSFMDAAWFLGSSAAARQQQCWFIHIAQGRNIRTADLPIPYTKRMAHHFLTAPADCTIYAALRWGQIHGLGGDARLADAVRATRLAESFDQEDFWNSVLRFLIANPMLDTEQVGPIVDFLYDQRFRSRELFVAPGVLERQPPAQPNLSMKGRTAESLLRQVQRWHRQLSKEVGNSLQWVSSGLAGYQFLEGSKEKGNLRRWEIQELVSARALSEEGRAMRHCVASYAGSCARRATSIWSMQVESFEGRQRVLTIEVRLTTKTICQARGKNNVRPGDKARNIMRRWAQQEGLTVASYV